jgi:hypothetical protein
VKHSLRNYAVLAAVFAGAVALPWLLPGAWRGLAADVATLPAVVALLGALYQLVRDEAA